MATVYANPLIDGSYNNLLNYFDDAGDTIPHGSVPNSGDDVIQQGEFDGGSLSCATLNGGGQTTSGTGSISAATSVVSLVFNSGGSFSSPLVNSTHFMTDPGFTITGGSISPNTFDTAANFTCNIVNTGADVFGASGFSGTVNLGAGATINASSSFAGTVTAGFNLTTGQYGGTTSIPGRTFSAEITGGTLTCSSFTGTHTAGAVTCTGPTANYHPASYVAGTATFSNTPNQIFSMAGVHQGLTIPTTVLPAVANVYDTAPAYGVSSGLTPTGLPSPNPDDVLVSAGGNYTPIAGPQYLLSTQTYGVGNATPGTLTLSAAGQTLTTNGAYGVAGSGTTPTATLPSANNVIFGSGAFGVGGTGSTPNWYRPNSAASDVLAKVYVDSTVTFGVSNGVTGTDIAGALAASQVKKDVVYGPAGGQTGSLASGGAVNIGGGIQFQG